MQCTEPRSNSLSTRNVMVIYSHLATTMVPHRTQFLLLAALLIPTSVCTADLTGPVISVLDGDTIEVLTTNNLRAIASAASTVQGRAMHTAS